MLALVVLSFLLRVAVSQFQDGERSPIASTTSKPLYPAAPVHYVDISSDLSGGYKFGYETGKGPFGQSFREEIRHPNGTVKGMYRISDKSGDRIIRYTAGEQGFVLDDGTNRSAQGPAPLPLQTFYSPVYKKLTLLGGKKDPKEGDQTEDDDYYEETEPFVDVKKLSYSIGTQERS